MKKEVLSIILIVVLGFGVYSNSLKGAFVWDDEALIEDNLYIKDFKYLPDIFTRDLGKGSGKQSGFYRPLQTLSYMLDHRFWGFKVTGYHLTNIFLHVLVAIFIFFLGLLLFKDYLLSLLAAVLFVVHPVHTEAVAYISGRADSLAALFMLLAFIFYLKNLDSKRVSLYFLMIVSYALALLSRESSLILTLAVLFYHYIFKKKLDPKGFICLITLAFIYIVLRSVVLKLGPSQVQATAALPQRLPGFFFALSSYPGLLLFPSGLHMEYTNKLFSWTEPRVLLGLFIAATSIYILAKKRSDTLMVFSLGWFFIFLFPHSNIYPLTTYMAEHWIYLSSMGFFLVVAGAFSRYIRNKRSRPIALSLLVVLVGCLSMLTLRQNTYWQDPLSFYKRTLQYAPESWRGHNNLGKIYRGLGNSDKAAAFYRRAIKLKPDYPEAHSNLGNIYYEAKDYPKAIASYKKALIVKSDYANAYYNLGNAYYAQGRILEAITSYKKAIGHDANSLKAYNNLGICYQAQRDHPQAIAAYKEAIGLDPDYSDAYSNLGNAYSAMGREREAIAAFARALELNSDNALAHNNLSVVYFGQGRFGLAIEHADAALALGYPVHSDFLELLAPHRK